MSRAEAAAICRAELGGSAVLQLVSIYWAAVRTSPSYSFPIHLLLFAGIPPCLLRSQLLVQLERLKLHLLSLRGVLGTSGPVESSAEVFCLLFQYPTHSHEGRAMTDDAHQLSAHKIL